MVARLHPTSPKGEMMIRNLIHDVRFSARVLIRTPGFTLVAVLTLALAIGVNTAIFSAVEGMLLHPLPNKDPGALVFLSESSKAAPQMSISPLDLKDWQAQNTFFEHLAGYRSARIIFSGKGSAEVVRGAEVNESLFAILGVNPTLGRTLRPEEDRPKGAHVVVIGEGFAIRHFGSAKDSLGKPVTLDGEDFSVIGVMPESFHFPSAASEVWVALNPGIDTTTRGNHPGVLGLARLKKGITLQQARVEMDGIAQRLGQASPSSNKDTGASVIPLAQRIVDAPIRQALWLLLGAAGFVLLIACSNVINLALARATERKREIAVRLALGATPSRIARILITESLLLALGGGALGVELARWGMQGIRSLVPVGTPRANDVHVDMTVLLFTLGICILVGLAVGLAPAWRAARPDLVETLKQGGRSSTGGRGHGRMRNTFVVAEVALSLILLIGTGLLAQSFVRVLSSSPGLDPSHVVTMQLSFTGARYNDSAAFLSFLDPLLATVQALPGVESAGAVTPLPLSGENQFTSFAIEGRPSMALGQFLQCDYALASPDYFRTMRIPLLRGRFFTEQDLTSPMRAVIIDAALARRDFPAEDPIGRRISFGVTFDTKQSRVIVGVVNHVTTYGVDSASLPVMFEPANQIPFGALTLVIRTPRDPAPLIDAVHQEIVKLDPSMPLFNVRSMGEVMAGLSASRKLTSTLLGGFSVLALILAAAGIYGVISYGVSQRTHEIGVRMALGAEARGMLTMVIGEGLRVAAIGVAIGWGGALALGRVIASQLFEVSAVDPKTYFGMAALLAIAATLGCWVPARRATRVDPLVALRYE
jgi:putative ABC transport system permease protein